MSDLQAIAHHRDRREVRPMQKFGRSRLDHLVAEYRLLAAAEDDPHARGIIQDILAHPHHTWADLAALEKALLALQPVESLRRRAWSVRDEFRAVAGSRSFAAYLASNPPDPESAPAAVLRADLDGLTQQTYWLYESLPAFEHLREAHARRLFIISLTIVAIAAAVLFLEYLVVRPLLPSLVLVAIMGLIGGLFSVQARIHSVKAGKSPASVAALEQGWFSIFFAPISGAVFAVVLYLMFIGGFLRGTLFPEILAAPGREGVGFDDFALQIQPAGPADYAKLLVWSFVAGFAERLVPDTLDRLAAGRKRDDPDEPAPQPIPHRDPAATGGH